MKQFNNVKSFSLIEVAIAIALLAFILGGMLSVFDRGFAAARKSRQSAIAYSLIREKLEEFSSSAYPSLFFTPNPSCTRLLPGVCGRPYCPCRVPPPLNPGLVEPPDERIANISGFSDFEREVDIECPYLGYSDLARIQVTVWWNNGAQSQVFETLKANY